MKIDKEVYLITDSTISFGKLLLLTEEALQAGVTILQYRNKNSSEEVFIQEAMALKELCDRYQTKFIINDRVDIAMAIKADGVHIGQSDISIIKAREIIGDKIIGVTAKTVDQAYHAQKLGADYIGVGALYPSPSKPDALRIDIDTLQDIRNTVTIPIVGIGGITANNITKEIINKVDGIAVISEVYNAYLITEKVKDLINKING